VIGGGLAAEVSLLRAEFDVDVYEKAPELNEVGGDIRGRVLDLEPVKSSRNRWFADSPLEGDGFEPSVPVREIHLRHWLQIGA